MKRAGGVRFIETHEMEKYRQDGDAREDRRALADLAARASDGPAEKPEAVIIRNRQIPPASAPDVHAETR